MNIDSARLKKGQILARRFIGFGDRLPLRLGSPQTEFAHYAILANPVEGQNDWLTFNATVGKTMELVPLSRYRGQQVRIYTVKNGDVEFAWREAVRLLENHIKYEGLWGWNYLFRLVPSILAFWIRYGPRRVPWDRMPNVDSPDRINCMVMIRRCYPNLIPSSFCASAGAFEQAHLEGRLILEQEGLIN